jgi:hypothetical protein
VLASAEYLARLNAPTPWSRKLMPLHANMVRSQCVVLESVGAVTARFALTIRFSPSADENASRAALKQWMARLAASAGIAGAHLLKTDAPPLPATVEQQIRGNADRAADWIFLACGYDADDLRTLEHEAVGAGMRGLYRLSLGMAAADTR